MSSGTFQVDTVAMFCPVDYGSLLHVTVHLSIVGKALHTKKNTKKKEIRDNIRVCMWIARSAYFGSWHRTRRGNMTNAVVCYINRRSNAERARFRP